MIDLEKMSATQRLTHVLVLCLTAPSEPQFKKAVKLVDFFAHGLNEVQIEGCKSAALQMAEGRLAEVFA